MTTDVFNKLVQNAAEKMDSGDFEGTLSIVHKMTEFGFNYQVSFVIGGILIDVGTAISNKGLVEDGVELIEQNFEALTGDGKYAPQTKYNLANGYYSLFNFEATKDSDRRFFKTTKLDRARLLYRQALSYDIQNPQFKSEICVNLGNCYDNLGRVLDALEYYEEALKLNPKHGMALGNKGIALGYYAQASGEHEFTFLLEAYSLLTNALQSELPPERISGFYKYQKVFSELFPDQSILEKEINFPGYEIKARSKFEKFLQSYCIENGLYLNICNCCQKCNASIGDSVVINKMILPTKEESNTHSKDNSYFQLSEYLNQIKQDYITARFLLILSRYNYLNLDFVDRNVRIVNTFDNTVHNIYIQLVKTAFKTFYDVLDKIAYFLNDYLELGIPSWKVDFSKVWYKREKEVYEKIKATKNLSLNALFDLHRDFENGPYRALRKTRNALTHRFVNIREFEEKEDYENMTETCLINQTLNLAKAVRNAVIYLLHFVNLEETKKEEKLEGFLLPMFAPTIPDKLKHRK